MVRRCWGSVEVSTLTTESPTSRGDCGTTYTYRFEAAEPHLPATVGMSTFWASYKCTHIGRGGCFVIRAVLSGGGGVRRCTNNLRHSSIRDSHARSGVRRQYSGRRMCLSKIALTRTRTRGGGRWIPLRKRSGHW